MRFLVDGEEFGLVSLVGSYNDPLFSRDSRPLENYSFETYAGRISSGLFQKLMNGQDAAFVLGRTKINVTKSMIEAMKDFDKAAHLVLTTNSL
jgi:hypothetical protein